MPKPKQPKKQTTWREWRLAIEDKDGEQLVWFPCKDEETAKNYMGCKPILVECRIVEPSKRRRD